MKLNQKLGEDNYEVVSLLLKMGYGWIINDGNSNLEKIDRLVEKVTGHDIITPVETKSREYNVVNSSDNENDYHFELFASDKIESILSENKRRSAMTKDEKSILVEETCSFDCDKLREKLDTKNKQAIIIQKYYRGYMEKKHNVKVKQIVSRQRKTEREIRWLECIVLLQSVIRVFILQKRLEKLHRKAILIQKLFRCFTSRQKCYPLIRNNIQERERAKRNKLANNIINSIISIQAISRGYIIRKRFEVLNWLVVIIQRTCRKYIERMNSQKILLSKNKIQNLKGENKMAILIQKLYRGFKTRNKSFDLDSRNIPFLKVLHGQGIACERVDCLILRVQSIIRGYNLRKRFSMINNKAIIIQSIFRRYIFRKRHKEINERAIIIQRNYRKYKLWRNWKKISVLSLKLQAVARGYFIRHRFKMINGIVTIIQKNFRCYLLRERYRYFMVKITRIQSIFLLKKVVRKKQSIVNSIIKLQSVVRGQNVRDRFQTINEMATRIQTIFREYKLRQDYLHTLHYIVYIQRIYLARRLEKKLEMSQSIFSPRFSICGSLPSNRFLNVHKELQYLSIITVQSTVRGYLYRNRLDKLKQMVIFIQKNYRGYITRSRFEKINDLVTHIQKSYRGYLPRQKYQLSLKNADTTIQTMYQQKKVEGANRNHVCQRVQELRRKEIVVANSILVQKVIKGYITRQSYQKYIRNIIFIQSIYRERKAKKKIAHLKILVQIETTLRKSAATIQAWWRYLCCTEKYRKSNHIILPQPEVHNLFFREEFEMERRKGFTVAKLILVQKMLRGYIIRKGYQDDIRNIILIQNIYRQREAKRKIPELNNHNEQEFMLTLYAATIQARRRSFDFTKINKKEEIIILLQAIVRGHLLRKRFETLKKEKGTATKSILVQKSFRGYVTKQNFKGDINDIIFVQSFYRQRKAERKVVQMKTILHLEYVSMISATRIQVAFRSFICRRHHQKMVFLIALQSAFRGYLLRKRNVALTALCRGYIARKACWYIVRNVVIVQSIYRQREAEKETSKLRVILRLKSIVIKSTIKIQAQWRLFSCQIFFLNALISRNNLKNIIIVQSIYQQIKAKKKLSYLRFISQMNCILTKSATTIQAQWRSFECKKTYLNIQKSILKIQRFRGRCCKEHQQRVSSIYLSHETDFVQKDEKYHSTDHFSKTLFCTKVIEELDYGNGIEMSEAGIDGRNENFSLSKKNLENKTVTRVKNEEAICESSQIIGEEKGKEIEKAKNSLIKSQSLITKKLMLDVKCRIGKDNTARLEAQFEVRNDAKKLMKELRALAPEVYKALMTDES